MRILITGASGFLGARLARRLEAAGGHELVVLPSPRFAPERLDGVHFAVVDRADAAGAEVVYHLASTPLDESVADSEHRRVIVGGAMRLCEQLRRCPPRLVVVAGSAAEYGSGHGWREEDAPAARPDTVFGVLKQQAWELIRQSGLAAVELRLFTPFGEGEPARRLVPSAIAAALAGAPLRLRTAGTQTRDYCYAGDVIEAFVAAAGRRPLDAGAVINISTGVPRTVRQAARRVVELAGGRPETVEAAGQEPQSLRQLSGNPERARRLLGWTPKVDFDEGVRRAIARFESAPAAGAHRQPGTAIFEARARAGTKHPEMARPGRTG